MRLRTWITTTVVNTIQSGQSAHTAPVWKNIAQLGYGEYFQVENSGNAVAVVTPYDKKLSELAASLEDTRLYFGDRETRERQEKKNEATRKIQQMSSEAALARRATFNATASGESNFLGESELVDAISSGRIELDDIEIDDMPASLQAMAPEDQMALDEKIYSAVKKQAKSKGLVYESEEARY